MIMEYVEGASLNDVVPASMLEPWPGLIYVMSNVCSHLIYSHNLPQGVMHRDVRPSSIMIPNIFSYLEENILNHTDRFEVILLNYDMSWHANAKGQSISGNIEEAGYYAPEQLKGDGDAARTTLVDSYGVGMSLFYAFARVPPPTGGSAAKEWEEMLETKIRNEPGLQWRSLPERLRRLIRQATCPNQKDRLNMTQIKAELDLLAAAVEGAYEKLPVDYWAEEILSRSEEYKYEVAINGYEFSRSAKLGRVVSVVGDIKSNSVSVVFKNQATGIENRTGIDKLWSAKLKSAKDILASHGWEPEDDSRYRSMEILLKASISVTDIRKNLDKVVSGLKKGLNQVKLD
ncbi:hypothetical protein FFK22_025195 [Mycobacterium sp. KBS0706]|nr:hypothetical protein FFK22_025195 [Mycobacterium sp. KBS0706]